MAVGQQAKDIDGKVCKDKKKGTDDTGTESANGLQGRWSCQDPKGSSAAAKFDTFSKRFGELEGHDTRVKRSDGNKTPTGWPGTESSTHDTAHAVADELSKSLDRNQRNTVAGLLSKTISGAEVVEIRAVSTTSVMLNACYDLQSEGFSIVPYVCLVVLVRTLWVLLMVRLHQNLLTRSRLV